MAPAGETPRHPRVVARLRDSSQVTPLELFFDLVFVLGFTQCTALMAHDPSWETLVQGMLVLGVLWWAWVGYSWLTSVVDPEEGAVRLVIFGAMAGLLVAALSAPDAFGSLGLVFALSLGVVRSAHIALLVIADPGDTDLRRSVAGLAASTAVAVGLLAVASFFDGAAQGALWALALTLDIAGAFLASSSGWRLEPEHFAERHGLIVIIALGESIIEIGVGAAGELTFGIGVAAVLGVGLAAAMWWIYFDVVALVSARRLSAAPPGRARNELARDSYSCLHLPIVAGIMLAAMGVEQTIAHHGDHLHTVPSFALFGGVAVYLLGLVGFRYRHVHTLNTRRLGLAVLLLALAVPATEVPAIAAVAIVVALLWALIVLDTRSYGEGRQRTRRPVAVEA